MQSHLNRNHNIKSHAEAVVYFMSEMDIEVINTLLDDKRYYQNFSKPIFIEHLQNAFNEFAHGGDTILEIISVHVSNEDDIHKESRYIFTGNKTKNYLTLQFYLDDNDQVVNIYEGENLSKATISKFKIHKRIYIDIAWDSPF